MNGFAQRGHRKSELLKHRDGASILLLEQSVEQVNRLDGIMSALARDGLSAMNRFLSFNRKFV